MRHRSGGTSTGSGGGGGAVCLGRIRDGPRRIVQSGFRGGRPGHCECQGESRASFILDSTDADPPAVVLEWGGVAAGRVRAATQSERPRHTLSIQS